MSSVRKKDQRQHRLTVLDLALDVYDHTTNVIKHPRFDAWPDLRRRLEAESTEIYNLCRVANEDLDNRVLDEAAERLRLQKRAIELCYHLKSDIFLAQRKLHLRARKTIYWSNLVSAALDHIRAWNKSELERYHNTFGL